MRSALLTWLAATVLVASGSAQNVPTVNRLVPANGAQGVDPAATTELVVSFDVAMDTKSGWSVCGGGETFPKVGRVQWRDAKTLVLQAQLQPNRRYVMPLNCDGSSQRFRSAAGVKLAPTEWTFETGSAVQLEQSDRNLKSLDTLIAKLKTEYSYRDRVVKDWDAVLAKHRQKILDAKDDATWLREALAMLGAARDPHLWIKQGTRLNPTFAPPTRTNFAPSVIERRVPKLEKLNNAVYMGRFGEGDDAIGYLLIATFRNEARKMLLEAQDALDELSSCKAMIIDVRANGGGSENLARQIATWFVPGVKVYAQHRTKDPETGEWSVVHKRKIAGNRAPKRFDKPVAVLMGPRVVSSCEAFVLMMRQAPQAKLIGEPSRGSSGNPQVYPLANGMELYLPSWQAMDAEGHVFEGVGILPDIEVKTDPKQVGKVDPVLDRALEVLK